MPTFSTPIDPNNVLAISAKLHKAERGYTTRRLTAEHILRATDYAEERVTRLGLVGHQVVAVIHPEPARRGLGGASATAAVLQRVAYGWLLINAGRVPTRNLTKWTSLRSRVEVLIAVDRVTDTLIQIGVAAGIRFVDIGDPSELLREASRRARVPLPGERAQFVSDGRGRLIVAQGGDQLTRARRTVAARLSIQRRLA